MQRVIGIGGIFFKARDAERLREWYRKHLGLPIADWGGVSFDGRDARPGERQTSTVAGALGAATVVIVARGAVRATCRASARAPRAETG